MYFSKKASGCYGLNRLLFAVLFLLFVIIRLRWHSAWANTERRQINDRRETITASIFSLCLLFSHIGWLTAALPETLEAQSKYCNHCPRIWAGVDGSGVRLLHRVHTVLGGFFAQARAASEPHIGRERSLFHRAPPDVHLWVLLSHWCRIAQLQRLGAIPSPAELHGAGGAEAKGRRANAG